MKEPGSAPGEMSLPIEVLREDSLEEVALLGFLFCFFGFFGGEWC